MTSAIVCGDSLLRKAMICSGGVLRRNSNGRRSIVADRRAMISAAPSAPSERSSTSRAKSTPPSAASSIASAVWTNSREDLVGPRGVDRAELGHLERDRLDLLRGAGAA